MSVRVFSNHSVTSYLGVVKDYFLASAKVGSQYKRLWCSSSSMVFSELPKKLESAEDLKKLKSINHLFTGEFDTVLFEGSGETKVVDAEMGIYLKPKAITELDRLSYVENELQAIMAIPKGFYKFTPTGVIQRNEAFSGLSKEKAMQIEYWQFARLPRDPEIQNLIARGEAIYNENCRDCVANDFPMNSWSIQEDVTGTVATLKSLLWPGYYAYHRANTSIYGSIYIGDGLRNDNLPFMV